MVLSLSQPKPQSLWYEKAGPKFQMHNPSTWPRQARLAASGDWDDLKKLQEKLEGGLFEKK